MDAPAAAASATSFSPSARCSPCSWRALAAARARVARTASFMRLVMTGVYKGGSSFPGR